MCVEHPACAPAGTFGDAVLQRSRELEGTEEGVNDEAHRQLDGHEERNDGCGAETEGRNVTVCSTILFFFVPFCSFFFVLLCLSVLLITFLPPLACHPFFKDNHRAG